MNQKLRARLTRLCLLGPIAVAPTIGAGETLFDGVDAASRPVMKRARQRIEEIRKGDFAIRFVGPDGAPVGGEAQVRLTRHAFQFGCNLSSVTRPASERPELRPALDVCAELFNLARVGNFHRHMEPRRGAPLVWDPVDRDVAWARERGMDMRFHCLIYNYHYAVPVWSDQVKTTEEWWPLIEARIRAVAERYGDTVGEYDVINEMIMNDRWARENNPIHPSLADPEVGARVFRIADKYLPNATLVSLEAGLATTAETNSHFQAVYNYHKALLDRGAPVDVIGYQGHFYASGDTPFQEGHRAGGPGAFTMKALEEGLDRLATLGKPIHVTEFSPPSRNNQRKGPQPRLSDEEVAAWTVNFYTLVFSKPYARQITRWFVIDEMGGRGMDAGLLTLAGERKPAYLALRRLLKEEWTTAWQGPLRDGAAAFRGFFGKYEARVAGYQPVRLELPPDGARNLTARLVPTPGQ